MTHNPQVEGQPTQHDCPACEQKLWARFRGDFVELWCPHHNCKDARMNAGATAQTLDLAFRWLVDIHDNEPG